MQRMKRARSDFGWYGRNFGWYGRDFGWYGRDVSGVANPLVEAPDCGANSCLVIGL